MRALFISSMSLALLFSSSAFAKSCAKFSGVFQLIDNPSELTLTITQDKCKSVTFSYDYSGNGETLGKTYPTNGKRTQTYEDKDLVVFETAGMQGDELSNIVEDIEKDTGKTLKAVSHFTIDPTGKLTSEVDYYNYDGQIYKTTTDGFERK